jgi:hexosaminidase
MTRFSALLSLALLAVSPVSALWPLPTDLKSGSSTLTLSPSFHIALSVHDAPSDLAAAVARTSQRLKNDKHARLVPGRGSSDTSSFAKAHSLPSLTVQLASGVKSIHSISSEAIAPLEKRDESYTLTVPADGKPAVLSAKSALGLFRGLTTFEQIWYTQGDKVYTSEAPYTISDAPAYVRIFFEQLYMN